MSQEWSHTNTGYIPCQPASQLLACMVLPQSCLAQQRRGAQRWLQALQQSWLG